MLARWHTYTFARRWTPYPSCWRACEIVRRLARTVVCLSGGTRKCLRARPLSCYGLSMIIAIANSKGGVGKSTLSVHLAAWLHARGKSVILADCDMQQSSSDWLREAAPDVRTAVFKDAEAILHEFPYLAHDADYIIADGPGSNSESGRSLLLRSDFAIVPCKASMLEVRALAKVTDAVRIAQDVRGGLPPAIVVLSMVRESYRLTQDMKDAATALSLPVAQTPVTLRQVYADSPGQGRTVWSMGRRGKDAAAEIDVLFHEIMGGIVARQSATVSGGKHE